VIDLIFIGMSKAKIKPTKELVKQVTPEEIEKMKEIGIKILGWYWTLGRYDAVMVFEAASVEDAMKMSLSVAEFVSTETLVALPREEAVSLL